MFISRTSVLRCVLHRSPSLRTLSSAVSAQLVKELREKSGAPMMDCKKALSQKEVNGDLSKAMDWLRAKGIARATSHGDRVASEGLVALYLGKNLLTMVEINSETDFVSRNKDFQKFVGLVASTVNSHGVEGLVNPDELLKVAPAGDAVNPGHMTLRDSLGDIINVIRENIIIRRACNIPIPGDKIVGYYVHGKVNDDVSSQIHMGKVAAVTSLTYSGELNNEQRSKLLDVGKKLAMHVVAANPLYLGKENVPSDVVEKETAILREQAMDSKGSNKPPPKPELLAKIVAGKVSKRLSEITLLGQAHVAEEGQPIVSDFISDLCKKFGTKIQIESFTKWSLGDANK